MCWEAIRPASLESVSLFSGEKFNWANKSEGFKAKENPSIQSFQASKHPGFRATGLFVCVCVRLWLIIIAVSVANYPEPRTSILKKNFEIDADPVG